MRSHWFSFQGQCYYKASQQAILFTFIFYFQRNDIPSCTGCPHHLLYEWIPRFTDGTLAQMTSNEDFPCFIFVSLTKLLNKHSIYKWLETIRHRCDVSVMDRPNVVLLGYWLVAIKDKVVAGRKIQTDHSAQRILSHGYYISAFDKHLQCHVEHMYSRKICVIYIIDHL